MGHIYRTYKWANCDLLGLQEAQNRSAVEGGAAEAGNRAVAELSMNLTAEEIDEVVVDPRLLATPSPSPSPSASPRKAIRGSASPQRAPIST